MKSWITSDLHFGHANIMKFCPVTRAGFQDTDHMREQMIAEWNRDVAPEDETFILGDFAFLPARDAVAILRRLNGTKVLIEGNHDRKLLNDPAFRGEFREVHPYLRHNHGGHTGLEKYRARDVAFDATGRVVSSLDVMIADALKGEIRAHH